MLPVQDDSERNPHKSQDAERVVGRMDIVNLR
jgi:hypothetical protein